MKVSDQIRLRIESAIASGELLPGDAIDDVALADHYKVSRTPVREALLQLQAQGILSSTPRGGSMVAKMNLQQLLSLWELLAGGLRLEKPRHHRAAIGQVLHRVRLRRGQIQNPQRHQPSQQNGQWPRHQITARRGQLDVGESRQDEPTAVQLRLRLVSGVQRIASRPLRSSKLNNLSEGPLGCLSPSSHLRTVDRLVLSTAASTA